MSSLARISAKFVGQPYQLGAMDCFASILGYLAERGLALPEEFEGQTRATYATLFVEQPQEAKAMMIRLMDSLLPVIEPPKAFAGDILLLRLNAHPVHSVYQSPPPLPFLAIDGGNGRVLAATIERGVCQLPRNRYQIVRAWACRQQSL